MIDLSLYTLSFTIINLIVLFLLLRKFLIKPINDIIKQREDMIKNTIDNANSQKAEAEKLKAQYEETLAGVDAECEAMREKSRIEAENEYTRIIDRADEKSVKMIKDAEKTIQMERDKALSDMESQIAELAMVAAGKIALDGSSEDRDKAIYDKFLSEAGDN